MGNFSRRDTFDKMKHYVGVRLQQGVPIVDADWNEMEDIGKYELRAFLKWFVGNGVPQDNDGFRILPLAGGGINTIVLTSNKTDIGLSSVVINRDDPAAADALGFGPHNWSASRTGSSPAQLTGDAAEPFALADGMTLVISTDGLPEETVIFRADDFTDPQDPAAHIGAATAARVMAVINHALNNLTASVGQGNDFDIQGGDGTPDRAGRCLVEGWDVINESNLKYTAQPLYENAALADAWGVPPLEELELPGKGTDRTDVVYLDVWEREVDSAEDYEHLVHPDINIETCVRLKREWVVRVAQGLDDEEDLPSFLQDNKLIRDGHVYYPLARLTWTWEEEHLSPEITDLRLTGLSVISHHDVQQIVADAYGPGYTLDHDGQPNLKVSLREAINALLRGGLPSTPELPVSTDAALSSKPIAFEDSVGDIWVFWNSNRSGNYDIWYKRYNRAGGSWESDTQLTMDDAADGGQSSLEDSAGDIWVFWESGRNGNTDVWYNRYNRASDRWEGDTQLTTDDGYDNSPFAIADSRGEIWVFWRSNRSGNYGLWYNRCNRASGSWKGDTQLDAHGVFPFAIEDSAGDIWLFSSGGPDIWYNRYNRAIDDWVGDAPLTMGPDADSDPFAIEDSVGDIWVFWRSDRSGNTDVWYNRYNRASDRWGGDTQLTTDDGYVGEPFAIADSRGEIWVLWVSDRSGGLNVWYKHYGRDGGWGRAVQLTTAFEAEASPFALEDNSGDIWVFWGKSWVPGYYEYWYKKLTPAI